MIDGHSLDSMVLTASFDTLSFPDGRFVVPASAATVIVEGNVDGTAVYLEPVADAPVLGRIDFTTGRFIVEGRFVGDPSAGDSVQLAFRLEGSIINVPPQVSAGPDRVIECAASGGSTVLLEGSASDADGDYLFTRWVEIGANGSRNSIPGGPTTTVFLPIGRHVLELEVMDKMMATRDDRVTITIVDTTPPRLTGLTVTPQCLWPPNHGMVRYALGNEIAIQASDVCDPAPAVSIANIQSSEPENSSGDGKTAVDIVNGEHSFCVRAERSGTGSGRMYSIELKASDQAGNLATAQATIRVPHSSERGCGFGVSTPMANCP